MAAITLTRTTAPYLSANGVTTGADEATAINYPSGLRRLSIYLANNAGEMAPTGAPPAALASTDKHPIAADAYFEVQIKAEAGTVYVQSATHPTTIYAIGELL